MKVCICLGVTALGLELKVRASETGEPLLDVFNPESIASSVLEKVVHQDKILRLEPRLASSRCLLERGKERSSGVSEIERGESSLERQSRIVD